MTRNDFDQLNEFFEVFNYPDQQMDIPDFETELDYFGQELPPGT